MTDPRTPEQRHANMAAIRGKDTEPERVVRRYLWAHGFRYRLNHRRLPGKPDIVLRMYRTCIFVNGCFWHGHGVVLPPDGGHAGAVESSACCKVPRTNTDFWVAKLRRNQERDERVRHELAAMGWHSITVWECELRPAVRAKTLASLVYTLNRIFLQTHRAPAYEMEEPTPAMAADDTPAGAP